MLKATVTLQLCSQKLKIIFELRREEGMAGKWRQLQ
jgi:hypothetical protein